ncbi:WAT1-related protein At5g47470-like isoform X2 [Salvia miltiorrhiza]|uniref:WAT1-related protein At5g47470-like isoform X2 n=2 Tax=Salvia miltiorrhiza TaxID=226208 RepID=UPI0025AD5BE9|nr:WAT1-related protein At5g47470-like isoform X2 [Salvia miltiorrhiza]
MQIREANKEGERRSFNVSASRKEKEKEKGKEKDKEKEKEKEKMMGMKSNKREVMEEIAVVMGLISVQFLYAGNAILLSTILKTGLQPSSLIICSTFATFLVLSPLAILFERSQWPSRITYKLVIQLLLLSFGGVTVFQSLFMKGVHLTSPAVATAMPNLAPGLIFFIACAFRLERMDIACKYSRAKIAGTMLCVLGAVVMSLMQSAPDERMRNVGGVKAPTEFDSQTILGCMYLIAAVFVLSSQVVLQAITLKEFSASISLCAITSLLGSMITAIVEIVEDQNYWDYPHWPASTLQDLLGYSLVAGGISGMCVSFNAWAMKKRGPVVVSIFNPLGTVISAAISISLGDSIAAGRYVGDVHWSVFGALG